MMWLDTSEGKTVATYAGGIVTGPGNVRLGEKGEVWLADTLVVACT
ncbi:hypothetical protein ACFCYC_08090 [Streptomyces sp. NPDC056402]